MRDASYAALCCLSYNMLSCFMLSCVRVSTLAEKLKSLEKLEIYSFSEFGWEG